MAIKTIYIGSWGPLKYDDTDDVNDPDGLFVGIKQKTIVTDGALEATVVTQVTDASLVLTDVTTNNVSTSAHGFAPKAPNNTTTFLRGDATYAAPQKFVFRGDSGAAVDFSSFTTDGAWHDLDLSAIVPAGAIATIIRITVNDDAAGSYFWCKRKGDTNGLSGGTVRTQVTGITNDAQLTIGVDSNRYIQYQASNLTFSSIGLTIVGWYL